MVLPKIEVSHSGAWHEEASDAVALGFFSEGEDGKEKRIKPPPIKSAKIEEVTKKIKDSGHFSGKKNEVSFWRFFSLGRSESLVLLGLGDPKLWEPEAARRVGASLYAIQKKEKVAHVVVPYEAFFSTQVGDEAYFFQAFCEGYLLASYEFNEFKKQPEKTAFRLEGITVYSPKNTTLKAVVAKAIILAESVFFARRLGDLPGNVLTPSYFADLAVQMARKSKLKSTVLGKAALTREKMGLLLGVAQGSLEEPKLIVLEHRGAKSSKEKPIIFVGKGVTFDSGGISLKPAAQMEEMKYDMMGAGAVAGILRAAAELKIPRNIIGIIAAVENMPSGSAQKPGDIQRSSQGRTVEIVNTDAEGRLILADALEYAQKMNPQAIIDIATLTGAVVVALGTCVTGIMGNHRGLLESIQYAARHTGEKVWELPLYEEYAEDLKSAYADIRNSGSRDAGSSKGGTFLKFFIEKNMPWVHCDIAGAAYHRKDLNYAQGKNASGVFVRLAIHLLERWSPLE